MDDTPRPIDSGHVTVIQTNGASHDALIESNRPFALGIEFRSDRAAKGYLLEKIVETALIHHLRPGSLRLYFELANLMSGKHFSETGEVFAFPKRRTLQRLTGTGRSSVNGSISELKKFGLVVRASRTVTLAGKPGRLFDSEETKRLGFLLLPAEKLGDAELPKRQTSYKQRYRRGQKSGPSARAFVAPEGQKSGPSARAFVADQLDDTLLTDLTTTELTTTRAPCASQERAVAGVVEDVVVVDLLRMLKDAGVHADVAAELASEYPAGRVESVIAWARLKPRGNLAGFIREALTGEWEIPVADRNRLERARRVDQVRTTERREAIASDQRAAESASRIAALRRDLASLPLDQLRARIAEQIELEPDEFWKKCWAKKLGTVRSIDELPDYLLPPLHGRFPTAGRPTVPPVPPETEKRVLGQPDANATPPAEVARLTAIAQRCAPEMP